MAIIKRFLAILAVGIVLQLPASGPVVAQCSMCSMTAENATQHGNTQGKGLNKGILFLLAVPYLAAVGVGILWYKKYRSKKTVDVDNEPIALN